METHPSLRRKDPGPVRMSDPSRNEIVLINTSRLSQSETTQSNLH